MGSRSLHRHPTTTDVTSDAPPQTAAWRSQDVGAPVTQLSDHYGAWERGRPGKGSGGGRFEGMDGGGDRCSKLEEHLCRMKKWWVLAAMWTTRKKGKMPRCPMTWRYVDNIMINNQIHAHVHVTGASRLPMHRSCIAPPLNTIVLVGRRRAVADVLSNNLS